MAVLLGAVAGAWAFRPGDDQLQRRRATITGVALQPDGRTLLVTYLAGSSPACGGPAGVRVESTDSSVHLLAEVQYDLKGEDSSVCPLAARQATAEVTLPEPLGGRVVIDDKQSVQVPVTRLSVRPDST